MRTNDSSSTTVSEPKGIFVCPPFTRRPYAFSFSGYCASIVKWRSASLSNKPSFNPCVMLLSEKAGRGSGLARTVAMKASSRLCGPETTVGGGVGAAHGILIKGGDVLERAAGVTAVPFQPD